jgi:hypothetical protein
MSSLNELSQPSQCVPSCNNILLRLGSGSASGSVSETVAGPVSEGRSSDSGDFLFKSSFGIEAAGSAFSLKKTIKHKEFIFSFGFEFYWNANYEFNQK